MSKRKGCMVEIHCTDSRGREAFQPALAKTCSVDIERGMDCGNASFSRAHASKGWNDKYRVLLLATKAAGTAHQNKGDNRMFLEAVGAEGFIDATLHKHIGRLT